MNDEWLSTRESPGPEPNRQPLTISGTPEQLLKGLPVGLPTLHAFCTDCNETLHAGQSIVEYGYRTADSTEWAIRQCYCEECSPLSIQTPTLGVTELLAKASLCTVSDPREQIHRLCLADVAIQTYSPPREGVRP